MLLPRTSLLATGPLCQTVDVVIKDEFHTSTCPISGESSATATPLYTLLFAKRHACLDRVLMRNTAFMVFSWWIPLLEEESTKSITTPTSLEDALQVSNRYQDLLNFLHRTAPLMHEEPALQEALTVYAKARAMELHTTLKTPQVAVLASLALVEQTRRLRASVPLTEPLREPVHTVILYTTYISLSAFPFFLTTLFRHSYTTDCVVLLPNSDLTELLPLMVEYASAPEKLLNSTRTQVGEAVSAFLADGMTLSEAVSVAAATA